jgi:predicted DNA-binding protein YlxM (UPF0122 family)
LSHEWDNIQCVEWDGVPFKTLLYNYLLFIFILINFRFIMVGKGKKKSLKIKINNKISIRYASEKYNISKSALHQGVKHATRRILPEMENFKHKPEKVLSNHENMQKQNLV